MPGTSWICSPCPGPARSRCGALVPPPRVPARPSCLKEQGSDLCAVLEGRLRSFSTCESLVTEAFLGEFREQLPGGLECQRAQDGGTSRPGCVFRMEVPRPGAGAACGG